MIQVFVKIRIFSFFIVFNIKIFRYSDNKYILELYSTDNRSLR